MHADDVQELEQQIMAFVRAFGLLHGDQTPCGQPISVSEAHALTELARTPGLTQQALAGQLKLEKSTVSRLVAGLEQRGWVTRDRHPGDGRTYQVQLTEQGQRHAAQLALARRTKFERLLAALPTARRAGVTEALNLLVEALHDPQPHPA